MDTAKNTITEATTLLLNNKLFMLKFISLLLITPLFLLNLLHSLVAGPLLQKVEEAYETSSLDPKDVRSLVALEVPFFLAFSILWLFQTATTMVATVSAYFDAINTRALDLKEVVLIWIKSTSKKILYACLYAVLAIITLELLFLAVFTLARSIFGSNVLLGAIIALMAAITYPYLASICALGLVISVLEDGCQGARALEEARRLVHDRKLQSYVLMLILILLGIPIHVLFYVTSTDDDDRLSFFTGFPFILVSTSLFCLANYFTFAVFTLLYLEIKRASARCDRVELQLGPRYSLVTCSST